MASIVKGGGIALALIFLVTVTSCFGTVIVANARLPYKPARHLANDCNSPIQSDIPGCGGGGSGGSSRPGGRPGGGKPAGSSRCRKGCCGKNKAGECYCCP